ncbi:MAG: hypothetical protein WKF47_19340 [Geodermatophilaceae bacterium]
MAARGAAVVGRGFGQPDPTQFQAPAELQLGEIQAGGGGSDPQQLRMSRADVSSGEQMRLGEFVEPKVQVAGAYRRMSGHDGEGVSGRVGDVHLCPGEFLQEHVPVSAVRIGLGAQSRLQDLKRPPHRSPCSITARLSHPQHRAPGVESGVMLALAMQRHAAYVVQRRVPTVVRAASGRCGLMGRKRGLGDAQRPVR